MDEGTPHARGDAAVSGLRGHARAADEAAHLPRRDLAVAARARELPRCVPPLQANPCTRAHLSGLARSGAGRSRCRAYIGHFTETRVRSEASYVEGDRHVIS